jgi:hypothetical protein
MKRWGALLVVWLVACDQSAPAVDDLAQAPDLSQPAADMTTAPGDMQADMGADMSPMLFTPAAVWWSTGGSSGTGTSGLKGGFSVGVNWVSGRSVAPSGAVLRFGPFSSSSN